MHSIEKIYKPIKGYEGLYMVSSHGDVFSVGRTDALGRYRPPRHLKSDKKNGYNRVNLYDATGHHKVYVVHKLVLEAFKGPCPEGLVGRHLDGNMKNNNITNLEYGTQQENQNDAKRHGTTGKGQKNSQAKLTEEKVKDILFSLSCGLSNKELAEYYNVSSGAIRLIQQGKRWSYLQREAA